MRRPYTPPAPPPGPVPQSMLDRVIGYVSPARALKRLEAKSRLDLAFHYRGAETSRLRYDWNLGLAPTTPPDYELQTLRNRSRDLNRNDPVAAGATDTLGLNIVGRGLRLQSRLRAEVLGVTEERARQLQRQAEQIWEEWTPYADSGNRLNFDELQFLALRKIIEDGEVLALPVMADEAWRPLKRAVELLEGDRLGAGGLKTLTGLQTGVEVGDRGQPVAYWITPVDYQQQGTIGAYDFGRPQRIEARDNEGRPRVLHLFRSSRPGQLRGVPFFAPAISLFKDLADYLEAEVVAARVAACLAVFVIKQEWYQGAVGAAKATESTTSARLQGLEPGMIPYLQTGEDIRVVDPKRGGETFQGFVEGVLRLIGASLGLPYELLVKDFSKTNYSSARAALLEGRRQFITWRHWFAAKFCQPTWELVLEEAFLRGRFDAPKFYDLKAEYCRAQWIGGGWGWVDPVKEVVSSKLAIDYGISTLAEEAASQGRDWEEILEQRAREEQEIQKHGLSIPAGQNVGGNSQRNNSQTKDLLEMVALMEKISPE